MTNDYFVPMMKMKSPRKRNKTKSVVDTRLLIRKTNDINN